MCGIFCYIGDKPAYPIIKEGLKELEYRGYDSCGISILDYGNFVNEHSVTGLDKLDILSCTRGTIGVGHTRWATHGKATIENAHPISNKNNTAVIAHNGIIENVEYFQTVDNYKDTQDIEPDTRILHYVEYIDYNKIKGRNVFVNMDKSFTQAVNLGGSLFLSTNDDGVYISSENNLHGIVYEIPSGFMAWINNHTRYVSFHNIKNRYEVTLPWVKVSKKKTIGATSGFNMLKEIEEQPAIIKEMNESSWFGGKDIFVGSGSSYHAALYGAYLNGGRAYQSSQFIDLGLQCSPDREFTFISQSGETADTIKAMGLVNYDKISTITNELSTISGIGMRHNIMRVGTEYGVAATKTYTAALTILFSLAYGKDPKLSEFVNVAMGYKGEMEKLAALHKNTKRFFFLGGGLDYVTALEAALKLKEITYVHAEGFPNGELKHGPISLIDPDTLCIFLEPNIPAINQVQARGGQVYILDTKAEKPYKPIVDIIPLQYFAYYMALEKGLNPDKPRNLAKAITVL